MSLFTSGYTGVEIDEGIRRTYEVFSNPNLLHNWDFRNPVNQRGITTASTSGSFIIDRWKVYRSTATVDSTNKCLTLSWDGINGASGYITTLLEGNFTLGDTYTLSVKMHDGTVLKNTFTLSATSNRIDVGSTLGLQLFLTTNLTVMIHNTSVTPISIDAIKLELGSVSTLANDPPADYGEQLALCKRFYRLWTTDAARTEALKEVGLMRTAAPTTGTVVIGGVTYYSASAEI